MPFRCKCGRTFEKTDTFASHTSSCAPFHNRRMSDTTQFSSTSQSSLPFLSTSPLSFMPSGFLSGSSSAATSPTTANGDNHSMNGSFTMDNNNTLSSSVPTNAFFMPTALSIQNAFEGARRRSMSYGSSLK